jgi:hypothetical protein
MVSLNAYIEKRLRFLNQTQTLKNLKIDKRINIQGFETAIAKTAWGAIVFQSNGKRISETWLTLSEIKTIFNLCSFAIPLCKAYPLKPLDMDLHVIS